MKKTLKRAVAVLCIGTMLSSLSVGVVNAGTVQTSISVVSTTTSSKSISALTKSDTYKVRDAYFSLTDSSVNRMASEHFQIIWGNSDTTGTVTDDFIKGNLINLENIRSFYINELGMKDIGTSTDSSKTGTYKTNVYVSGTGLTSVFEDDWAYMSSDDDGYAYLFVAPGAMRVDEPSWVIPHELAHAFTYHQGGSIPYAWYESSANWFRDRYLGSEYYAYGGTTYGPTSDFFAPYMLYSSYYVPHMLNWYDTWPLFIYISENPDNIDGLGMELMHKIFEYNCSDEQSMYEVIETLSGVSIKEILGGMSKRLATMDFERQEYYLMRLNTETLTVSGNYDKIYSTLGSADSQGYQTVSSDRMPMQTGFNIIPLDVDLTKGKISVDFVNTSTESGADFRTTIVTTTANNKTRYSDTISSGKAEITLNGDETKAYLVVCATPDTIENFNVDWDSSSTDSSTRFTYKVKISTSDKTETTTKKTTTETTTKKATTETTTKKNVTTTTEATTETTTKATTTTTEATTKPDSNSTSSTNSTIYNASDILANTSMFTVTNNGTSAAGQIKLNENGSIAFTVKDGATVTVNYKCGSSDTSKSAAVVVNGNTSAYIAGKTSAQDFTVSNLSAGTCKISAVQNGGTTAQILSITISYNNATTTKATTQTTTKATTTKATTTTTESTTETTTQATTQTTTQASGYSKDFSNGTDSDYYTIVGSISSGKGSVSYNGTTYTSCLKMESSSKITFKATKSGTLTLVFDKSGKKVKIDGKAYTTDSNGVVTAKLSSGTHTVTKGDSINLYFINFK